MQPVFYNQQQQQSQNRASSPPNAFAFQPPPLQTPPTTAPPISTQPTPLSFYQANPTDYSYNATPAYTTQSTNSGSFSSNVFESSGAEEDELPLLEELGINFDHIWKKTRIVLKVGSGSDNDLQHILDDTDLAGPLFFCLSLGCFLLLTGKIHFGYIYGFGVVGCLLMYLILNLMSDDGIDLSRTVSILGYCLLPVVILSAINVIINLRGSFGFMLTAVAVSWCTLTATRIIVAVLKMEGQQLLIAYPTLLLFSCFAMITVF